MNKVTDKELKKYYTEISKLIICGKKQKTEFLSELKSNVNDFLSQEDELTIEGIHAAFGTPEEIGKSFMENCTSETIKKKLDIKKCVLIFLAAALVIYLIFVAASLIDVHTESHGYMKEGIITIITYKGGELQ